MKGNRRNPQPPAPAPSPSPVSPTAKGTAKYTNKDGSKFITVPKPIATDLPQQSLPPVTAEPPSAQGDAADDGTPPVNRKKAKRRAKAAAKAKAELVVDPHANGISSPATSAGPDLKQADAEDTDGGGQSFAHNTLEGHGNEAENAGKNKKSKKKKKKGTTATSSDDAAMQRPPSPRLRAAAARHGLSKQTIWNPSPPEEREHIKEFWLGLGEEERKGLVKVEKDAVLKKMKEQQKHTCGCAVCGRRQGAIEEELEGLYDAYYEELEQYAHDPNHQGHHGPPMMGPPQHHHGAPSHSHGHAHGHSHAHSHAHSHGHSHGHSHAHSHAMPSGYAGQQPSSAVLEHAEDEEGEEYSDEELDDDEDDEEGYEYSGDEEDIPADEIHRDYTSADFLNFGSSLAVEGRDTQSKLHELVEQYRALRSSPNSPSPEALQRLVADVDQSLGGILTVADDLLQNDGQKFIRMMEQLADRRLAREGDLREPYVGSYPHGVNNGLDYRPHHLPSEDEEDDEEGEDYGPDEDEEGYTSQDDGFDEEEDALTEEQRMEEGRRMFQIFAARMFEQRVLAAYREKVAKERQDMLLEEIADEEAREAQAQAKKANQAQKRKDKAAQKKQAQAEEKARKDADKAAAEEQRKADENRKAEEQRAKAEEKRRKKEEQKKSEDDERIRKAAEKARQVRQQQERQAELERKAREAKEMDKKAREDRSLKEKEARDRKEREGRERREKQDKDKRDKEARTQANEAREKQKQVERAAHKAAARSTTATASTPAVPITLAKRPSQHHSTVPALPQQRPASFASPQIPVATPALPKAPALPKTRQPSQHSGSAAASRSASQAGSGQSQNPSPNPATPIHMSPSVLGQAKSGNSQAAVGHGHTTSPHTATIKPGVPQPGHFSPMPAMGMPFPQVAIPPLGPPPGFGPQGQFVGGANYRAPGPPQMLPMPPGISGPPGRGFQVIPVAPPPGFGQPTPEQLAGMGPFGSLPKESIHPSSHSRQPSGSFDSPSSNPPATAQPIARPGPIGRPRSVVHGQRTVSGSPLGGHGKGDAEDPRHLGSKALLEDEDFSMDDFMRRPPPARSFGHGPSSFPIDVAAPTAGFSGRSPIWDNPLPYGTQYPAAAAPFGDHWGAAIPLNPFAPPGRPTLNRGATLRRLLVESCAEAALDPEAAITGTGTAAGTPWLRIDAVKARAALLAQSRGIAAGADAELERLYDTEGDAKNGGGLFDVQRDAEGTVERIRFQPDGPSLAGGYAPPGPVPGSGGGMPDALESIFSRMRGVGSEVGSPVLGSGTSEGAGAWGSPAR